LGFSPSAVDLSIPYALHFINSVWALDEGRQLGTTAGKMPCTSITGTKSAKSLSYWLAWAGPGTGETLKTEVQKGNVFYSFEEPV
jgi:hypothetical protein